MSGTHDDMLEVTTSRDEHNTSHSLLSIVSTALLLWTTAAHAQYDPPPASGPYYFVSDTLSTPDQSYHSGRSHYGGVKVLENLNLLATVLGDDPLRLLHAGQQPVAPQVFDFGGGTCLLRPFAFATQGNAKTLNLPLGPRLKAFLNNPLAGAQFDLTLPFSDANVGLSSRSALIRSGTDAGVWHTAVDFDYNGDVTQQFDVVAPADGVIEGTSTTSTSLTIRHTASNGKQYLTVYQHLIPQSKGTLHVGASVVRGQTLARIARVADPDTGEAYAHLHFGVAVLGPAGSVGGVAVPEMWYLIDPFGVYDYRRHSASSTAYNYLPSNTLSKEARGVIHAYVWRTNPPVGSLLLKQDCVSLNSGNAAVTSAGPRHTIVDGDHFVLSFPTVQEASSALKIMKQYKIDRSCFIGRPEPSFQYLLSNDKSPQGAASGEDCVSFSPANITLKAMGDERYQMISGSHAMFVFPNMLEAGNALSVIKKYGFARSCFVGRPDASLQYMRK